MLEDTYAHTPLKKLFEEGDCYAVAFDEERASRKPVKLGIIGCGGVALSKHIPAIMRLKTNWEPVELAAICRPDEREGKYIEKMYGCHWYDNHEDMLKNERLDGVMVLSPDDCHAVHALACIEAGMPVLGEKPITRSLKDAETMCRLADDREVPLMTVSNKRYSPPYRRAKKFVTEGPVDNPAMYVGKFNLSYDYVDLFEAGTIHLFDLTRYFMGDVKSVNAVGVNKYNLNKGTYPIDNAIISFEFTSGSIGSLYTSSTALSLKPWERVEIYGKNNWLTVEDQCELILYDSEEGPTKSWRPVIPNTLIFDEEFAGFVGLIENFLQVIRGEEEPRVTGWDGYRAYELNLATHLSLSRNERISLPLDPATDDLDFHDYIRKLK